MLLSSPWDTIKDTIEEKGITEADLAQKLGYSLDEINKLSEGKLSIDEELASKLEYSLNVNASLWLNLEKRYREELKEISRLESSQTIKKGKVEVSH